MTRDFLKNLDLGEGAKLPDAAVEAIMARQFVPLLDEVYKLASLTAVLDGNPELVRQGADINFMIIHKPAVIQFAKHVAPKIIDPSVNQNADAYKFGYRKVGIADAYENKVAGIYLHHKDT